MKRKLLAALLLSAASLQAFAGGYITNTNQSVSFLRQPAQNAEISVNSAYFNPAGVAFLPDGWQLSLGLQNVHQTRQITSSYAPFALNAKNGGSDTYTYKGYTSVPVLPAFDLTYVNGHFFGSVHFGVIGGGGSAAFDNGLGSFESRIAIVPALVNKVVGSNILGYDMDMHLDGNSMMLGGQLNVGYRFNDHLSVSVGARVVRVSNHYDAALENIRFSVGGNLMSPSDAIGVLAGSLGFPSSMAGAVGSLFNDRELDCKQNAWGVTPIIGVDYKVGKFNFAGRYEFNTSIRLKNSTKVNTTGMEQYDDAKEGMANDIAAMLSLGARYEILPSLRVNVGYNQYFDKQSKMYNSATGKNDKTDLIEKNPYEIMAGIEYDINSHFTVSGGAQMTRFSWGKDCAYINDMSFTTSSVTPALGLRYNLNKKLSFDLAVMNTFYEHSTKYMADYNGVGESTYNMIASMLTDMLPAISASNPELASMLAGISADSFKIEGTDKFFRTSLAIGLGINFKF